MSEPLHPQSSADSVELAETPLITEFVRFLREDPRLKNARDAALRVSTPSGGDVTFRQDGQVSVAFPVPDGLRTGFLNRPNSTVDTDMEVLEGVSAQWIREATSGIVTKLNSGALHLGSTGYELRAMKQVDGN